MIEYVLTWMVYRATVDVDDEAAFIKACGAAVMVTAPAGWIRSTEGWS